MKRLFNEDRIAQVLRIDSITESEPVFLSTHIPVEKLIHLQRFDDNPRSQNYSTEEELYRILVKNPDDRHRLIAVYGQSGSGKSHLIRWMYTKLKYELPENEEIIFIQRGDNSLKGSIKQLLKIDAVKNLKSREEYERLVKAQEVVEPEKLKDAILDELIRELNFADLDFLEISVKKRTMDKMVDFLRNREVRTLLLDLDGPIEKIYTKIAGANELNRDLKAEFLPSDFMLPEHVVDSISQDSSKLSRYVRELISDTLGEQNREQLASLLNFFVDRVIKKTTHIQAGDFKQIFTEIRQELAANGKNLTILIEDITSFTGVDGELVDVLIQDHRQSATPVCRLHSILGTTTGYLGSSFRDNQRDRITDYIYIPENLFEKDALFAFVGRYLNAVACEEETLQNWLDNGAKDEDLPIAPFEGQSYWDSITVQGDRELSLSPFTQLAIEHLYQKLPVGHRTPRYVLTELVLRTLNDIKRNPQLFPPNDDFYKSSQDRFVVQYLRNFLSDEDAINRTTNFLMMWGNGRLEKTSDGTVEYISQIAKPIFEEFQLPIPEIQDEIVVVKPKEIEIKPKEPTETKDVVVQENYTSEKDLQRVNSVYSIISNWKDGESIKRSRVGDNSFVVAALDALDSWVCMSIDWKGNGISPQLFISAFEDNISGNIVFMEGEKISRKSQDPIAIVLPRNIDSLLLIDSVTRWVINGKESWDYPGSEDDALRVSEWIFRIKDDLISKVKALDIDSSEVLAAAKIKILTDLLLHDKGTMRSIDPADLFKMGEESNKKQNSKRIRLDSEWKPVQDFLISNQLEEKAVGILKNRFTIFHRLYAGSNNTYNKMQSQDLFYLSGELKKFYSKIHHKDLFASVDSGRVTEIQTQYQKLVSKIQTILEVKAKNGEQAVQQLKTVLETETITESLLEELNDLANEYIRIATEIGLSGSLADLSLFSSQKPSTIAQIVEDIEKLQNKDQVSKFLTYREDVVTPIAALNKQIDKISNKINQSKAGLESKKVEIQSNTDNRDNLNIEEIKGSFANTLQILGESL